MLERARRLRPDARIAGVTVHPMILRPKARELIAGIADDPTFGPVVVFGRGGTAVEVIDDKALALPPLDLQLARDLIARTRISRLLKAYRNVPAADADGVALVLVKLAQLAADLPEVRELDLNPLLADETGVIALDARVAIAPVERKRAAPSGHPRFAIRPYPREWERHATLRGRHDGADPSGPAGGRKALPARSSRACRRRTCGCASLRRSRTSATPSSPASRSSTTRAPWPSSPSTRPPARCSAWCGCMPMPPTNAPNTPSWYARDLKGKGLGWTLMQTIIEYARSEGLRTIDGQVLNDNVTMLQMCAELGFRIASDPDDASVNMVSLDLSSRG